MRDPTSRSGKRRSSSKTIEAPEAVSSRLRLLPLNSLIERLFGCANGGTAQCGIFVKLLSPFFLQNFREFDAFIIELNCKQFSQNIFNVRENFCFSTLCNVLSPLFSSFDY